MTGLPEQTDQQCLRVLGPVMLVRPGGREVTFSQTQRRILARLALSVPRLTSLSDLIHAVWEHDHPASARQAVLNQISRIRQAAGGVITTVGDAYELAVATDAQHLAEATAVAERLVTDGDGAAAFDLVDRALALHVGEPLTEIDHVAGVFGFRKAVAATVTAAENTRLEAALLLERRAWAMAEAERLAAAAPLDERRAANHARALTINGRRGDALAAIARVRRALRTELGIEPGPDLAAAEAEALHGVASGASATPRITAPPFAGRDAELREALRGVAQRRPVRVRGEHGSGVSRMLFEIRTRLIALGITVVLVRADEHPSSAVSLLEEILTEIDVPVVAGHSVLSSFVAAVNAVDAATPLVLIVDDAQMLGPSAWEGIQSAVTAANVGVVLGGHGSEVTLPQEVPIVLGALTEGSVGAIAHARGVTDPQRLAWLVRHAGGNPLAVQVLADIVADGSTDGAVPVDGAGPADFVTATPAVTSLVDRLVRHLDAERRRDLELAAVAGDGYPRQAFDHLVWPHPVSPPEDLVEVTPDGAQRFRHGAVRALIYQALPRGLASDLHHALGIAAQRAGAPPATAARHLLAAADLDPEEAVQAAREAARAAAALGAHADATEWLARAVAADVGSDPARSLSITIEHADAMRLSGDPAHLPALLTATERALEWEDDALIAAAGFALLQLGGSTPAGGLDKRITAVARRAIAAIGDPEQRAAVQAAASLAWSMTGNAREARRLFDEAEKAAIGAAARLRVLPFAYLALGMPADLPRRSELADELVSLARASGQPVPLFQGLHLQFSVHLQRGQGAVARECLREMESLIDTVGDVGRRWGVLYLSATVAQLDGDDDRCERLADQARAMFGGVSPARAAAAYYGQLLPVRLEQGRLAELRRVVEDLVAAQPGVTAWHAALALVLAASGGDEDIRPAREHARLALDLAQPDFTWLAGHVVGGRAAALLGDTALARRYVELLEPWADLVCWQGTCSYGPVAEVLAALSRVTGDEGAANGYAARAAQLATSLRGDE